MPLFNLTPVTLITPKFIQLLDRKASGVVGGAAVVTSWQTRIINAIEVDETGLVTLANNLFTLPMGNYQISLRTTFYSLSDTKIRLQNTTDNTTLLYGINAYFNNSATYGVALQAAMTGKFAVAAGKQLALQYWTRSFSVINQYNLGGSVNDGSPEIYTAIDLNKVG